MAGPGERLTDQKQSLIEGDNDRTQTDDLPPIGSLNSGLAFLQGDHREEYYRRQDVAEESERERLNDTETVLSDRVTNPAQRLQNNHRGRQDKKRRTGG